MFIMAKTQRRYFPRTLLTFISEFRISNRISPHTSARTNGCPFIFFLCFSFGLLVMC